MINFADGALTAQQALQRESYVLPATISAPAAMASPPTVTNSGVAPTLARRIYAGSVDGSRLLPSSFSGGLFTYSRTVPGKTSTFMESDSVNATGSTPTLNGKSQLQVSFVHDGSNIELGIYSATTYGILVRVDGQYVSLTP
ncbi:MAG: hypothetical protein KGP14_14370, partial [Betaproteobacteria bacterium]|nr:hypothetical protein [Betaproteobacteria bacterium]